MFTHILEKNMPRIALEVYKKKMQALGKSLRQYIESSDIYHHVIPEYYYDFYASNKALKSSGYAPTSNPGHIFDIWSAH